MIAVARAARRRNAHRAASRALRDASRDASRDARARVSRDSALHSGARSPITTETEQPSFRDLCSKGVSVMAKKAKKKATKKAGRKKATKKTARRKK
ncbi:MAG TPA: hypothetical protein VK824_04915 [Planctomycetota bacterium]|nr:hypothetical protein [Planctomycetota bacterium]